MASLRFWVCLILVVLSFVRTEPQPFSPFIEGNGRKSLGAFIEQAKEEFKERLRREDDNRNTYKLERQSPGGPDPKHHSKNA